MTFYDSHGNPVAYTDDVEHIYLFSGKPAAYLSGNNVYGYNGHHFGWIEEGWIIDKRGRCVLYTDNASGGPVKPINKIEPIKGVKKVNPVKSVQQVSTVKPISKLSWSEMSGEEFFAQ